MFHIYTGENMPSIVFSESELTNSRPGSGTDTNSGHNVSEHLTHNRVRATFGQALHQQWALIAGQNLIFNDWIKL